MPNQVNSHGRYSILMLCQSWSSVGKGQGRLDAEARTLDTPIRVREVLALSNYEDGPIGKRSPGTATIHGQGEFGIKETA